MAEAYFSTLSHNVHDFWEEDTEYKMCILIFSINLFEIFLILRGYQWDMVKVKYPLFSSEFKETLIWNPIVALCIFVESLQFIDQWMHI